MSRPRAEKWAARPRHGVLLEIATDQPGFTVDEPLLELGRELKLPPWLEPSREQITAALPPLRLPDDSADHSADDASDSAGAPA
jgi:glyoxalase family protein